MNKDTAKLTDATIAVLVAEAIRITNRPAWVPLMQVVVLALVSAASVCLLG
mgnify:CR=1 FL=1